MCAGKFVLWVVIMSGVCVSTVGQHVKAKTEGKEGKYGRIEFTACSSVCVISSLMLLIPAKTSARKRDTFKVHDMILVIIHVLDGVKRFFLTLHLKTFKKG